MPLTHRQPDLVTRRRRNVAILALLGLLMAQFALAAHQADHRLGDLNDRCAVCLQFDRNDHAIPADAAVVADSVARQQVPVTVAAAPFLADLLTPRPRGPPVS